MAAGLVLLPACSGDEGPTSSTTAPSPAVDGGPTPTTEPAVCGDLADRYLDAFFALGAGTPRDPQATTVRLPVDALLDLDRQARRAGCADFVEVACSAHAELEAQGLRAVNSEPPAAC
ncbi:MAG TPA: hypothetical protein VD926_13525 [Acidimicrobiales bacterium]|nr:hypothetical protein [Acidimicrobiales bacterium]